MILETFKVGSNECNCSILASQETKEAVVVDPGGNAAEILERVSSLGVKVRYVLITHAHFDHVVAARAVRDATGATICLHRKDMWLYLLMPLQYRMARIKDRRPPLPDRWLKNGDRFEVGELSTDVLHTPGHSPGSCCFHVAAQKVLFSGDTLFRGTVGAWKYPGGSLEELVKSFSEKLLGLPDDTRVIPGHGDETTIGYEREHNFLLQPDVLEKARVEERQRPGTIKAIWLMIAHMLGFGGGKQDG